MSSRFSRALLALAAGLSGFAAFPAFAGGVHTLTLSTIPVARSPIAVDGNLSDWPDTRPVTFSPLNPGLVKSSSPAMMRLRREKDSATLQSCYNSKALYVGITWTGIARPAGSADVELHVDTDRVANIRIAPVAAGHQELVQERFDGESDWHALPAAKSAAAAQPSGTVTQEIRIPWANLTKTGTPPASLTLALDFEWSNLTPAFIKSLPTDLLHNNTHLTACFLTSPNALFGLQQYLGNPNDWGQLKFVDQPHANVTQVSPMETGATESYVQKVQTPIDVDGRLTEWNPAQFQTFEYMPALLGDRYSAKFALAYDGDYLYIAEHEKSLGGPLNTEPEATQTGYVGGDCLQIRLNDGQNTTNLCAWYDSVQKKPALTADGGDLKNPYLLSQGAKEAFQTDPDGQGYTQEIAIPWRVLPHGAAPNSGDAWKATFQVWFSGLNPQFTAIVSPTLALGGGIPYTYHLPQESNVTLGVYDAQGHLLRDLVKDAHRRAGSNTEYWDGKDQFGNTVAPGRYIVKGISHPPISVQHVISIGNPGSPPWPTADGTGDWLSDEASPQAAATDGTNVYLAAPGVEKGSMIIAVGPDGKRLWGYSQGINPRCATLSVQGNKLYLLYSGPMTSGKEIIGRAGVICLDKNTGVPAGLSSQRSDIQVATWPFVDKVAGLWDLRVNKTFTPADYEGQTRYSANDVGEPSDAVGIAATPDRLYVSMLSQNQILVLDAATGKQLDTISVTQPVGLHLLPDGRLLGISDGKVVTIDPATKTVTTLIAHDLVAPHSITTDTAGNIYVSDWGNSFQVKVFSPRGTLLRAIGTPGGRPWIGKWDANGMLLPRGIAVTNDGKLWVAEDDASPNRVSVWNAATGAFIRDYIGPSPYGGGANFWVDPANASTVVAEGVLFHVDYAKKTWTPVATPYRRMSMDEPFTFNGMAGMPGAKTVTHSGKQYVYWSSGSYSMTVYRHDGMLLRPVAAAGCLGRYITTDGTTLTVWDSDIGYHNIKNYYPAFFKGHNGDNYVWVDKNGDGQVQPDEVQWAHTLGRGDKYVPGMMPEWTAGWGFGAGPDGAIYMAGFCADKNVVSRLDLQGWTAGGAPIYDLSAAKPIVVDPSEKGIQGLYVDDNNRLIITRPYEVKPGQHQAVECCTRDGKPLWTIASPAGPQQVDDILADNVVGEFHEPGGEDVLATWLWHADFKPYLFTSDGLYVSSLLDDTRLGPTATWDESYKNYFQAPDGSAYIVDGVNDAYHIDKIIGLDHLHRFAGTLTATAADLQNAAAEAARASALPPPLPKPILHVAWLVPPVINGRLDDWNMNRGVAMQGSRGRSARVALGRDQTNLYLAYEVHGAKLVNKGANWQTLFITGDCDDLMLHVGKYSPHYTPAEGDERLLLSIYQGQPIAVLYRPVVPGSASSTRLLAATIDEIVKIPSAKIAYQRAGDGYTLEASIPLSALGIAPTDTETLRGDVGVIYADETGANRALRLYYYNQDTSMTADLTTEATLQPGSWGDVELPLGPNLMKNGDFEEPLSTSIDQGWVITNARNGARVTLDASVAYTGSHSLLMQQTTPVIYTPDAYNLPDYGKFINSANGGAGGGYAEVTQRVPVTPGKSYILRFHLRTLDFPGGENKNVGPNRGYATLETWLNWEGGSGGVWATNHQDSTPQWAALMEPRFNYFGVTTPYLAPPGSKYANIQFHFADNHAANLPKTYIDDVEFVEAP